MNPPADPPFRAGQRGFTLVELMVTVLVIALLAALSFPGLSRALERSRQTRCLGGLHSLGSAFLLYAGDNGNMLPPPAIDSANPNAYWRRSVLPYVGISASDPNGPFYNTFTCPDVSRLIAKQGGRSGVVSYGMNYSLAVTGSSGIQPIRLSAVRKPSSVILATDGYVGATAQTPQPMMTTAFIATGQPLTYHLGALNVLYVAGNVATLPDGSALLRAPLAPLGDNDAWNP